MLDAPIALAFTGGMIATVNPCGFAMLPAYLGYFLGLEGSDTEDTSTSLVRALVVGAVVSAGFLLLFAVAGAIATWTSLSVGRYSPWLTVAIGLALMGGGVAFIRGWEPRLGVPRLERGGDGRGLWSMFLFGLSYAIASLSCTLAPFTAVVATTFSRESLAAGVVTFAAYGFGMALLLMVLTVTLALARQGLVGRLRRTLPYVQRASGALMALMGAYLTWYGIYEIRLLGSGRSSGQGPVDLVTGWSTTASEALQRIDPMQVALVLALAISVVVLVVLVRADRRPER